MSHIGGGYSNITVVQRVTPALRVEQQQSRRGCHIVSVTSNMKGRVFYLSIST